MQTSTLTITPCANARMRDAVDRFCELLKTELLEDLEERPHLTHSAEEVLGTIKRETFDVQMAVYRFQDSEFRRETFDLVKKVGRCWIDYHEQVLLISH